MIFVLKTKIFYQIWIILLIQMRIFRGEQYDSTNEDSSTTMELTIDPLSTLGNIMPHWCDDLVTSFEDTTIYWPKIANSRKYVTSSPVCLDVLKFPKFRYLNEYCMNKKSLHCTYIQSDKITSYCPNGELALLIQNEHKICFSNSTKYASRWDYTPCLQYGSILPDFIELSKLDESKLLILLEHIRDNMGKKFWLPIRRENSYSPLQYFIPFLWKRYILVNLDLKIVNPIANCLAIEFIDKQFVFHLENCNNHYPMLCAYDVFDQRKIDCINDTYVLHAYPYTTKYSYVQNGLNCPYGHISVANSPETTKLYQKLLVEEQCVVNAFPNKDIINSPPVNLANYSSKAPCGENCALNITDWIERFSEIDYINWNVKDIGYGDKIVVDSTGGWLLFNNPRCTVCEDTIGSSTIPTIVLESNRDDHLTLIISVDHLTTPENVQNDSFDNLCNFKELLGVNCFAQYGNMEYENFHLNELAERNFNTYSSENITTVIDIIGISYNEVYSIKVNRSGRFWCEGYSIYHNLVISSDDLYVDVAYDMENFATILKITDFGAMDQYQVEYTSKHLQEVINSELEVFEISLNSVQFKTFITVNYAKQQVIALVHFELTKHLECEEYECVRYRFELLLEYQTLLWKAMESLNETQFTFYSLNHTQFCLPAKNVINGTTLVWGAGELNEYVTTENFDLEENGLPIVRHCRGDNLFGVQWGIVNELNGNSIMTGGIITKQLFSLEQLMSTQSSESMVILTNFSSIVALNINQLIPADLFTISKVLSYLDAFNFRQYITSENVDGISNITSIIDSCTQVNKSVIQMSQVVNTTNKILYSFEMAISNIGRSFKPKRNSLVVKSSNVLVIVLNPWANNISGISVYKNLTKTVLHNDISDYYIEYILSNASITTFNEGFTIASFVPQILLQNLLAINQKLQLIITLFYNDALYQDEARADQLDSIIISVTIPGISARLPGFMPFYFTSKSNSRYTLTSNASMDRNNYCSYWNFQPKDKTINSEWSQDGCYFMGLLATTLNTSQISACACEHLTSFAFLVGDMKASNVSDIIIIPTAHGKALDLITLLGCSLSILGALGIFMTALVFPNWRRKSGILLQFSGAIAVQMILTLCVTTNLIDFQVTRDTHWTMCIVVGAAIQYSLLVVFSWTLISAYLQFKRYVSVFNSKPLNLYLKTFIVGWLLPLIPVLLGVFISPESYRKTIKNSFNVCYPTHYALYFTVLLPIGLIILANLTIFIIVVRNVFRMSSNKFHSNEKDLILSQLRLSVFLFFLLGLSWGFGLAISFGLGLIFSYLFCITATVQGLVLFIYFVLMDPETRALWINLFYCKSRFRKKLHM